MKGRWIWNHRLWELLKMALFTSSPLCLLFLLQKKLEYWRGDKSKFRLRGCRCPRCWNISARSLYLTLRHWGFPICSLSGILNQAKGGADPEAEERSPKEKGIGTEASERHGGGSLPERKDSLTLFSNKGSYLEKNQPPYNSSLNTKWVKKNKKCVSRARLGWACVNKSKLIQTGMQTQWEEWWLDDRYSLFFFSCLMKNLQIFMPPKSNQNCDYVSQFWQLVSCTLSSSALC